MRAALVDTSRYQGMLDAAKLRAVGFSGIVSRCTIGFSEDGTSVGRGLDFYRNSQAQARQEGVIFGAYHVLWPSNQNPIREADNFLAKCGEVDLAVIDVELLHGLPLSKVQSQTKTWLEHVASRLSKPLVVYTASWFWTARAGWENAYPLWEAEYLLSQPRGGILISQQPEAPKSPGPLSAGWASWKFWQWTSGGKPVGAFSESLDYNVFDGDGDALRQFLGIASPPPLPDKIPVEIRAPAGRIELTVTETG